MKKSLMRILSSPYLTLPFIVITLSWFVYSFVQNAQIGGGGVIKPAPESLEMQSTQFPANVKMHYTFPSAKPLYGEGRYYGFIITPKSRKTWDVTNNFRKNELVIEVVQIRQTVNKGNKQYEIESGLGKGEIFEDIEETNLDGMFKAEESTGKFEMRFETKDELLQFVASINKVMSWSYIGAEHKK